MATLTNIPKNRYIPATGGQVFFGFLFLFTRSTAATGPILTPFAKHAGSLTNVPKN
jgi:hypothetical protein